MTTDEYFNEFAAQPETVEQVQVAIRLRIPPKKFMRLVAAEFRKQSLKADLDDDEVDEIWHFIMDSESGKIDKRCAELFSEVRRQLKTDAAAKRSRR